MYGPYGYETTQSLLEWCIEIGTLGFVRIVLLIVRAPLRHGMAGVKIGTSHYVHVYSVFCQYYSLQVNHLVILDNFYWISMIFTYIMIQVQNFSFLWHCRIMPNSLYYMYGAQQIKINWQESSRVLSSNVRQWCKSRKIFQRQYSGWMYTVPFRSIQQNMLRITRLPKFSFRHLAEMTVTILFFQQC